LAELELLLLADLGDTTDLLLLEVGKDGSLFDEGSVHAASTMTSLDSG